MLKGNIIFGKYIFLISPSFAIIDPLHVITVLLKKFQGMNPANKNIVNCSKNIFMMPNKHAINNIILPYGDTTLLHDGGHPKFNSWVGKQLDNIYKSSDDLDSKKYEFWLLLNFIRENMNINQDNIPWE